MKQFSLQGKVANQWIVFDVEESQGQIVISVVHPDERSRSRPPARPLIKFRCPQTLQSQDEIVEIIRAKFRVGVIRWV
jgi:hypothetical protein